MDAAAQIAAGGEPIWAGTFRHPKHGDLRFAVAKTQTNREQLALSAAQDRIVMSLGGDPSNMSRQTAVFAEAVAGIRTLMVPLPAIKEDRIEDAGSGHVHVEVKRYEPLDDDTFDFAIEVWASYWSWRRELLDEGLAEVKKGSATIGGAVPDEPSPEATGSRLTTAA